MRKRQPRHDLAAIKSRFSTVVALELTASAVADAQALGMSLSDIVEVVQSLKADDFVKSATGTNPPSASMWHDSYNVVCGRLELYLKFAGEAVGSVVLTSFREL